MPYRLSTGTEILAAKHRTGQALADALVELQIPGCTETELATRWLEKLRQSRSFHDDGWYDPPPHGVIALFGRPEDHYARVSAASFRPAEFWPSPTRRWQQESIVALYASPVERLTNIIGDFGLNLYLSNDPQIIVHFEQVLALTLEVAEHATVGMRLCDLYEFALHRIQQAGFANNIESGTDQTHTNIGHTIPLSYASDPTHGQILAAHSYSEIKEALRVGRKFVNREEPQVIEDNFAFTVEPRLSSKNMPNTSFHLTVVFENGRKEIGHGFGPVLRAFNQRHLINLLP